MSSFVKKNVQNWHLSNICKSSNAFNEWRLESARKNVVFLHICLVWFARFIGDCFVCLHIWRIGKKMTDRRHSNWMTKSKNLLNWDLCVKIALRPTINNGIFLCRLSKIKCAKLCKFFLLGCRNNPTLPNRASEWVNKWELNHNFRLFYSGCNLSTTIITWFCIPLMRVQFIICSIAGWCFLCFNSVISLHSHNQFSTVQKVHKNTHPSIWHHFENECVILNVNQTDRFLLFFGCCYFSFSFDIVLPLHCSYVHVISREGGVDLPWPKFATWQQRTPIKSSSFK